MKIEDEEEKEEAQEDQLEATGACATSTASISKEATGDAPQAATLCPSPAETKPQDMPAETYRGCTMSQPADLPIVSVDLPLSILYNVSHSKLHGSQVKRRYGKMNETYITNTSKPMTTT